MRIYRMTATFGKLDHETLVLEPGLNVIEAPNEWGKSTWCAFLIAMLYGLDTRAKTTRTALADKEKFAPWSGSPMAGRIDLQWNGRNITIERSTKGRTPMGIFRAYETLSGLDVPELTGSNCGQMLLGVEQSVFRRTGFIRQSDMPVTQDDALRRRLNALVTTGDETGDSDRLADALKDLKNKCRYNRTGLLPQAEDQHRELQTKIEELESLQLHSRKLKERLGETKSWISALENHRRALLFAAAEADAARVAEAREVRDRAEEKMNLLEQQCARQPAREDVLRKIRSIQTYLEEMTAFRETESGMKAVPVPPVPPELFRGKTFEQAKTMVERDCGNYEQLTHGKPHLIFGVLGWVLFAVCGTMVYLQQYLFGAVSGLAALVLLIMGAQNRENRRKEAESLKEKYGSAYPEAWKMLLHIYEKEKAAYDQAMLEYRGMRGDLDIQRTFLQKQRESLFGAQQPEKVLELWKKMEQQYIAYDEACRDHAQAEKYFAALRDMAKPSVKPPVGEDALTYSAAETQKLLADAQEEQQRLQNRLGQYQGRMEALGDAEALLAERNAVQLRIEKLEETYSALTLALETIQQARQELQRRFAPRISGRAQALLGKMTAGRYDRLMLQEDLSLLAGAAREDVLREVLWRSDGTMDQLYFALRLAVAEELTPDAPLVLDDAFIRYDDIRLNAAMHILQEEALQKQVILFTCQSREKALLA